MDGLRGEDAFGRERKEIFTQSVFSAVDALMGASTHFLLISTTAPLSRYDCLHFIEEETEVPRVSVPFDGPHNVGNGRVGI